MFWADSKVVLGYIANDSKRFHVFVANRVQQIRDQTEPNQWQYVRTDENPADHASRGLSVQELLDQSMWLKGPDFLWKYEIPTMDHENRPQLIPNDLEVKKVRSLASHVQELPSNTILGRLERFSDWYRAKRAIAACLNLKAKMVSKTQTRQLSDPTSLAPLMPNHLLTMKSSVVLQPPGQFEGADKYSRKSSRWRNEYLRNLQAHPKWTRHRRDMKEGDIVIVKDENMSRNQWQLARVHETYPSEDGHVRKVKLAMASRSLNAKGKQTYPTTYLDRPIQKLVLLVEGLEDKGFPDKEP